MRKPRTFLLFLVVVAFVATACGSSQEPEEASSTIEAIPLAVETTEPSPEPEEPEVATTEPEPTIEEPEAYPSPEESADEGDAGDLEAYPPPEDSADEGDPEEPEAYPSPDDTSDESGTDNDPQPTEAASNDGPEPLSEAAVAAFAKAGCAACHTIPGVPNAAGLVGPNLSIIGLQASERKVGLDAENYIRESILDPNAFIAPMCPTGECPAGVMPPNFRELLTDEEINLIVEYLLTLTQ